MLKLISSLSRNVLFTAIFLLVFSFVCIQKIEAASTSAISIPDTYVNIGTPRGMVMLPDGNIWYIDSSNTRIIQYDPDTNQIVRSLGRNGDADGEFHWTIYNITRDNDGFLYVLAGQNIVYKLDANGGFIGKYYLEPISGKGHGDPRGITYDAHSDSLFVTDIARDDVTIFSRELAYLGTFGSEGTGPGQFIDPWGITTDVNGKIYVTDAAAIPSGRLQVFNPDHSLDITITSGDWGALNNPKSVVVLSTGIISVTSESGHTVLQFDSDGGYIRTWPYADDGRVQDMINPEFIVRDSTNNIYVSDWWLNSITKYSSSGSYLGETLRNNQIVEGHGNLLYPRDVAYYDTDMYVLDGGNRHARLMRFSNGGTYIDTPLQEGETGLGITSNNITFGPDGKMYISSGADVRVFYLNGSTWTFDYKIGSTWGNADGQFEDARDIAFYNSEANGQEMFVADRVNSRIQIFSLVLQEDESYKYEYSRKIVSTWDEFADPYILGPEEGQLANPQGLVINSAGKLIVGNYANTVMQFDAVTGLFEHDIGEIADYVGGYVRPTEISIDSADNIYVSDIWGKFQMGLVYNSNGVLTSTFGGLGSGQMQFNSIGGSAINPVTGKLSIVDSLNGRVETLTAGSRIINLITSANVIVRSGPHTGSSLSNEAWQASDFPDTFSVIPARLMFGDYVVADFTVDLSNGDLDWTNVNVQTLPWNSKSLVVNLSTGSAPGISATHSLYLVRYSNQHSVTVCPDATTLAGVVEGCSSGYTLLEGDSGLDSVSIDGNSYWKIDGLEHTGAFSSLFETGFTLRDLMTRQQVNTSSNHTLVFGTTYNITHDTDTITVTFGSEWNLGTIAIGNLELLRGSTSLALVGTLNADPDVDLWGVSVDTGNHQIIFTAPTNTGSTEYISSGDTITVLIKDNVLVNPTNAASYPITMFMVTVNDLVPGEHNSELGSVTVPVVDSDQVDVTGYVNAYLNFDIDTATSDMDCNPNGSTEVCTTYGGGPEGTNYTVDLGELSSAHVNKSLTVANHSDGSGYINAIYFDLTTNAPSGAIVTVSSANEGLQGPGTSKIASVDVSGGIGLNSGLYGFNIPQYVSSWTHGDSIVGNDNCSSNDEIYCGLTTDPVTVFDTNNLPIDSARVRMDVAAAASYTNNPGSYTDTLTFVATGTF